MATGQYLTEVALGLAERGHEVTVVTSRRAYDHPETVFPNQEIWRGIRIHRIYSTGFGKCAKWRRALDFASFLICCCFKLARLGRQDAVVALTSPPLISFLGAWMAQLRGSRFYYWVMDFNPDEAIAAGWLRPGSIAARVLERMSRFSLREAARVIALDRFMQERILAKGISKEKVAIVPPWSHDDEVRFDKEGRDRFRKAHGLEGKFVVMYSGNHSPCHPLDTLLAAARSLADESNIVFCFIGGGSEFTKVQAAAEVQDHASMINHPGPRILCLPYQPLKDLAASLSAADLHVVVMGNPFVGLVHPCKIYNILSVGSPVLYIGPSPSHVTEILEAGEGRGERGEREERKYAAVGHREVDTVVGEIQRIRRESGGKAREVGRKGWQFSKEAILPRLLDELESE